MSHHEASSSENCHLRPRPRRQPTAASSPSSSCSCPGDRRGRRRLTRARPMRRPNTAAPVAAWRRRSAASTTATTSRGSPPSPTSAPSSVGSTRRAATTSRASGGCCSAPRRTPSAFAGVSARPAVARPTCSSTRRRRSRRWTPSRSTWRSPQGGVASASRAG